MSLQPSLITSFDLAQSLATPDVSPEQLLWPSHLARPVHADIYLMMEPDVIAWNKKLGRSPSHQSALEFFTEVSLDELRQVAETICANADAKNLQIPALTSFFPSLSLPRELVKRSHEALISNLIRLALLIGKHQASKGSPQVPVVQMVAGSLISQIEPGQYGGRDVVYAESGDPENMFGTVVDQIAKALQLVSQEEEFEDANIESLRIAFELEPGPIYLLSDRERIENLCDAIDNSTEAVKRCVGFNLDIPHWWLAENITPEWIQSDDALSVRVRDRIYHSHIAGHSSRGHFGDMSLKRMPPAQISIFRDWLRAIEDMGAVKFVSLEIEAAKSFSEVLESVETLLSWLPSTAEV